MGTRNLAYYGQIVDPETLADVVENGGGGGGGTVDGADRLLSNLTNYAAARANMGLGSAAVLPANVSGGVALFDDPRLNALGGATTTFLLTNSPILSAVPFTSRTFDRQGYTGQAAFKSVKVRITANAPFTAILQGSADLATWTTIHTFAPTTTGGTTTVNEEATESTSRYERVVITATNDAMTILMAEIDLIGTGLGTAASKDVGVTGGVASWDDTRFANIGSGSEPRSGLASGEETFSRLSKIDSVALTNSRLQLTYFTARKSETTTQVRVISGSVAAVGATLVRVGLYLIASDGGATLVAATASDTNLFTATNTQYVKAWAASYAKVAGQRYALGILSVGASAQPTVAAIATSGFAAELAMAPRVASHLNGQTDLPSTFTDASLAATAFPYYAAILP